MIGTETAVRAAVAVAREQGLRVTDPVVLKDSYNVRVHLRPAPVVARVPTVTRLGRVRPGDALRRELDVAAYLQALGFPVVPPSGELPPGPHVRDGVAVSFLTYVPHHPGHVVTPQEAGRALAALHEALRGYPGRLPVYGPVLGETARLLEVLENPAPLNSVSAPDPIRTRGGSGEQESRSAREGLSPAEPARLRQGPFAGESVWRGERLHARESARPREGLSAGELARLREAHAGLTAALPRVGLRPVHGDAHPGNLLATGEGLLWNDFEEGMLAPAGWDLAVLRGTRQLDGRAAVTAYGADPDDPGLAVFRRARRLQAVLWQLAKGSRFPGEGRAALDGWLREG